MKVICFIGYSGSGKTHQILNIIRLLDEKFNYKACVIKNIHEHPIDNIGKDSYRYSENGAAFSITRNKFNETAIYIRNNLFIPELVNWIKKGPFPFHVLIMEGFRNTAFPTVLCVKEVSEIEEQLTDKVLMISGRICERASRRIIPGLTCPCFDIEKNFSEFIKIFNLP
ncbi:MAG: molybdopterin-guanine dinucleotide biosynthesis protein B [Promethearchaeota archaeon]